MRTSRGNSKVARSHHKKWSAQKLIKEFPTFSTLTSSYRCYAATDRQARTQGESKMVTASFKSPIEELVDRLFSEIKAKRGECCANPATSDGFEWGIDPIAPQKRAAVAALRARELFAINGPPDAPPLPLSIEEYEDYRSNGRGLRRVVGFFGRSLKANGYDIRHPSFEDFARGLIAMCTGLWQIEKDENLKKRFPPRPLAGMTASAIWAPPEVLKPA
jgi:hypothetical protein